MNVNYIAEIKAFYDRLELNPQPNSVIALWHALMSIANKWEWPDTFTAAQSSLMLKSGLSASAFKRARNKLAMDGFIEWKSRGGSLSAQYKINSLVIHYRPQGEPQNGPQSHCEPQSGPQSGPQSEPQSEPINKQKQKHKQKNKNTLCNADADALLERLWVLYPVKKGKGSISAAQKKKLLKIGYDEMARAIERYKRYVESVDYLHYKNGSTFFNSGYVDYLDANYQEGGEEVGRTGCNTGADFEDPYADELERLLNK